MPEQKQLRPYQTKYINDIRHGLAKHRRIIAQLPTGGGKCLGKNTPVLMFDGTFKMVQNVKKGDLLMGIDSTPRKVLSKCKGIDNMYKITPLKGEPFICNGSHMLSLKSNSDDCGLNKGGTYNISVNEYITLNKTKKHTLKLYRCEGYELPEKETEIEPYLLGIWLGDGGSGTPSITSMDKEIIDYWYDYAASTGQNVRVAEQKNSRANGYYLNTNYQRFGFGTFLRKSKLKHNKHIPDLYKYNSRKKRLELLAGIIDTDGYLHHGGYEVFVKHDHLAKDIIYLCRSLGFYTKSVRKEGIDGNRITFYGDGLEKIPVKLLYKKASPRKQLKNAQVTQFKVEAIGEGEYFGFAIDGDHLFMVNHDLTVTHNSFAFITCAQMAIKAGKTVLILSESRKIYTQIEEQIQESIEIKAGVKHVYVARGSLYLGMAQTLKRRPAIIEQFQELRENLIVIADEAHLGTHTKVLAALSAALLIGITATPNYDDAKHLPLLYNACITGPQINELVQDGYLCPYTHFARVGADMEKLELGNDGDFTEKSQETAFGSTALYDGLIEDLKKIPFTYCMVFCASIKHCEDVAAQLEYAGLKCVTYHTRQENSSYNLMQYETGRVPIMVSVGALTKGYDFPPTDLICMVRATTSLCLCWQIFGRASRPADGKKRFTVLDYGSHYKRFGFWDQDFNWEKMWQKPKKRKKDTIGAAPVKECPECGALIPPGTMVCPFCAAVLEKEDKELQQGVLVDLTAQYNALVGRKVSTLSPEELAMYAKLKNKRGYAARIAKAHEQKEPGWLTKWAKCMEYKEGWVYHQMQEVMSEETIEFYDIILR